MSWPTGIFKKDFAERFGAIATAIAERSTLCGGLGLSLAQQAYKQADGSALTALSQLVGIPIHGAIMKYNFARLATNVHMLFNGTSGDNTAAWRNTTTAGNAGATFWTWSSIVSDVGLGAWNDTPNVMYSPDWLRMQGVLDRMCYPFVTCVLVDYAGDSASSEAASFDGGFGPGIARWVELFADWYIGETGIRRVPFVEWYVLSPPAGTSCHAELFNGPQPSPQTNQVTGMEVGSVQISELYVSRTAYWTGTGTPTWPTLIFAVNGVDASADMSLPMQYLSFASVLPTNIYSRFDPAVTVDVDPFPGDSGPDDSGQISGTVQGTYAYLNLTNYVADQA